MADTIWCTGTRFCNVGKPNELRLCKLNLYSKIYLHDVPSQLYRSLHPKLIYPRKLMNSCLPCFLFFFTTAEPSLFAIQFVNGSPRFSGSSVLIDFISTQPITTARCFLGSLRRQNCMLKEFARCMRGHACEPPQSK